MMKKTLISGTLLCIGLMAHAQTKKLNLQQCLDMAMQQNYDVLMAQKSVERAKVMQGSAWDLDKTEVALSQDPSSGGNTDNAFTVSQSIDFPTVYIAQRRQLKAETQMENSRMNVTKLDVSSEVRSAYYQLVYEMERLHILTRQDSILSHYKFMAQEKYKAGETRQLDLMAAERMHRENKLEMTNVMSEIENAQLRLSGLLNSDVPVTPSDQELKPLDFVQTGFNYPQSSAGQLAQDRIKVADKAVSVAKSGYAPSLSLALRSQMVISSWNPYHVDRSRFKEGNFFGFEVGVGVPLFYGATKAKVKAAKKDREIAELEMKQEQQTLQREYMAALSRCNASFGRLTYYQEEGVEKDKELERLSHLEYENGEISYMEYVESLKNCIEFHMNKAAAINEYNQNVIALEKLMESK